MFTDRKLKSKCHSGPDKSGRNPEWCALYGIEAQGRDDRLTFWSSPI